MDARLGESFNRATRSPSRQINPEAERYSQASRPRPQAKRAANRGVRGAVCGVNEEKSEPRRPSVLGIAHQL